MSSLPGYTLESYLMWQFNITVDEYADANPSLEIAEVLLNKQPVRKNLTKEQFQPVVDLFELFRDYVERQLENFDEGKQSWRDYAGYAFTNIPDTWDEDIFKYINGEGMLPVIAYPIVCAAMKFSDGTIIPSPRHWDKIAHRLYEKIYPNGCIDKSPVQGFLDSIGRFLTREEAFKAALIHEVRVLHKEHAIYINGKEPQLCSECLY